MADGCAGLPTALLSSRGARVTEVGQPGLRDGMPQRQLIRDRKPVVGFEPPTKDAKAVARALPAPSSKAAPAITGTLLLGYGKPEAWCDEHLGERLQLGGGWYHNHAADLDLCADAYTALPTEQVLGGDWVCVEFSADLGADLPGYWPTVRLKTGGNGRQVNQALHSYSTVHSSFAQIVSGGGGGGTAGGDAATGAAATAAPAVTAAATTWCCSCPPLPHVSLIPHPTSSTDYRAGQQAG